jgi:hypothetical protein
MGVGPAVAIPAAVEAAGLQVQDIDLFELNEVRPSVGSCSLGDYQFVPAPVCLCSSLLPFLPFLGFAFASLVCRNRGEVELSVLEFSS